MCSSQTRCAPRPASPPDSHPQQKKVRRQTDIDLPCCPCEYRPSRARSSRSTSSRSGTLTDRRRARPRAPTRTSSSARPPSSRIRSVAATTSSSSARPVSRLWFSWGGAAASATRDLVADLLPHPALTDNNDGTPNKYNHRYSCMKTMEASAKSDPWVRSPFDREHDVAAQRI